MAQSDSLFFWLKRRDYSRRVKTIAVIFGPLYFCRLCLRFCSIFWKRPSFFCLPYQKLCFHIIMQRLIKDSPARFQSLSMSLKWIYFKICHIIAISCSFLMVIERQQSDILLFVIFLPLLVRMEDFMHAHHRAHLLL
jgi:hypothetical protein